MANEISLVTASGSTVTPKDDGIIYEVFSPGNGIIYGGAVTIKDSSTLHITAGHGIVCGRKFTIDDSDIPISLSGSGSLLGRLYIHLDLADAADPITLLVETGASLTPVVQDSDVNINNGVYEINVATFDVDTVTISNLVDVAPYLNTNGYEHEQINNALGNTDISGIGDGSVTGAINTLNADKANKDLSNATGTLDVTHGGTGNTSLQATRNAMGLGNTTGALPVANGGTGATTAANARTNLGLGGAATQAVANNLTTTAAGSVLDARQGKALSDKILSGLKYNGHPSSVTLSNYTSANPYTASSDGYVLIGPNATVTFKDFGLTFNGTITTYIKKGMQLYGTASSGAVCIFTPINQTFA